MGKGSETDHNNKVEKWWNLNNALSLPASSSSFTRIGCTSTATENSQKVLDCHHLAAVHHHHHHNHLKLGRQIVHQTRHTVQ